MKSVKNITLFFLITFLIQLNSMDDALKRNLSTPSIDHTQESYSNIVLSGPSSCYSPRGLSSDDDFSFVDDCAVPPTETSALNAESKKNWYIKCAKKIVS